MRHFSLTITTLATLLSLAGCASDMHKDDAEARSYRNQRSVAQALNGRTEQQAQMERQAQQEQAIERAGGAPIPR